jgi:predicted ATPase/DNA-binding SARP family transcriptional activator
METLIATAKSNMPREIASGLELRLFGPMEVKVGANPLPHLRSRKGLWLLALLALRGGRDVDRDWIAGTLWPECDEAHGRRSLRQSLHDLRAALGPEARRIACDEPRTLRLDLGGISVDALEFDAALARGDRDSREEAVGLYRGPLLEDCAEEWALEGRRQREQAVIEALETLASDAALRQEYVVAANRLRAALRIDPFREDLQRALMLALAEDGSPAGALLVYRQFRALLGREMAGEPSEETTVLFRRLRDESRISMETIPAPNQNAAEAKKKNISALRQTLPIPLTALIGRDQDVLEVTSRLSQARLVTLTGTGGVGKTRLAIQVAEELAGAYSDGAVFVDLAPLENTDHVPDAVRSALGAPAGEGTQDPIEDICPYLDARRILLLLDNCEHLDHACSSLAETLLIRCPGLKILATSRQVLGVKGETVWRVPSLAVPKTRADKSIAPADILHVSKFLDFAAIRLFSERARAAESTFEISPKNAFAVVTICSRLDGIPLAIELAAARVKAMPVEKIAARLIDRFRILMGSHSNPAGPLPRHQTLRASIDWSYDLLSVQERTLLLRLAVFVGGWTLEAAEAVCSGAPIHEWEVLDLLTGLVEKSLVVYLPNEDRYRLLETIRQYLTERVEEDGEQTTVPGKHLEYFLALAETAEPELKGPRQSDWMDRLEADHDNLRAALNWSRGEHGDSEFGLRLAGALFRFWQVRGFLAEGREQLALALAGSAEATANRANALNNCGILAYRQSDYPAARSLYEESLAIRRELGDLTGIASSLNNLGVITLEEGDRELARSLYEECLAICRGLGNRWGTALCLNNLGTVAFDQGEYDAARGPYEESLAISRELGDQAGIAYTLYDLGCIADRQRDYVAARSLHEESLAIRRELGDRLGIAQSLHGLGLSAHELGDLKTARSLQIESLEIKRDLGDRTGIAHSLEAHAYLAIETPGDLTDHDARMRTPRLLGAAEALREAIGAPLPPNNQNDHLRRVKQARETLDEKSFEAAWAEGRTMTLEKAISFALS